MKFLSWLFTVLVTLAAIAFAVKNTQMATIYLWPLGFDVKAPLYLFTLGTLLLGVLLGAVIGWALSLPHRAQAHRLKKDIAGLREKFEALQSSAAPQRRREDRALLPRMKKRLWGGR